MKLMQNSTDMKTKYIVIALVANFVLLIFFAGLPNNDRFDKITVKEFEMVDANGKQRASIKVEPNGEVVFRLKDKQGTIRVKLGASEEGSALVLLDNHTDPGIHAMAKRDTSVISITEKGKRRKY